MSLVGDLLSGVLSNPQVQKAGANLLVSALPGNTASPPSSAAGPSIVLSQGGIAVNPGMDKGSSAAATIFGVAWYFVVGVILLFIALIALLFPSKPKRK